MNSLEQSYACRSYDTVLHWAYNTDKTLFGTVFFFESLFRNLQEVLKDTLAKKYHLGE